MLAARVVAERRNQDRLERMRRETDEHYIATARDFEEHRRVGNFVFTPRSRQLQMTRARVREERAERLRTIERALRVQRAMASRQLRQQIGVAS